MRPFVGTGPQLGPRTASESISQKCNDRARRSPLQDVTFTQLAPELKGRPHRRPKLNQMQDLQLRQAVQKLPCCSVNREQVAVAGTLAATLLLASFASLAGQMV